MPAEIVEALDVIEQLPTASLGSKLKSHDPTRLPLSLLIAESAAIFAYRTIPVGRGDTVSHSSSPNQAPSGALERTRAEIVAHREDLLIRTGMDIGS